MQIETQIEPQMDTVQAELGDFQLGPFQVFPSQSLLRKRSSQSVIDDLDPAATATSTDTTTDIHVEPKVMAVLERLAQEPQKVVSRHNLLDDVWTGTVVTEEVVTRCISELRTALGDDSRAPRFIQTIPKKGYKLLQVPVPLKPAAATPTRPVHGAPSPMALAAGALGAQAQSVATATRRSGVYWALVASIALALGATGLAALLYMQDTPAPAAEPAAALSTIQTSDPSIAILPFATLDPDDESNYFGAGLAEELLNALANVPGLRVISRHAAADVRKGKPAGSTTANGDISEIAKTLDVDTVLTGSVRRMNNNVRVTAQLVNAGDGVLMWADQFEGDLSDVFQIQDEIAAAIVGALRLQLTEPVRVARISTDMNALDYYLLGRHHWHQRTSESLARAIELFTRAVQVDPDMAIAYSGLADAYLLLADYGNMTSKEAESLARPAIETALRLDSNLAEAHASQGMLYLSLGQSAAAERALRNAVRLNPGYHMAHMWLGSTVAMQGKVKDAHQHYLMAYRLDPLHPVINQNMAMSFATIGDYESAKTVLDKLDPRFDSGKRLNYMRLYLAQQLGDFATLRTLAQQSLADNDQSIRMAGYHALWTMHSRLGEEQAANDYLARAQSEADLDYEFRLHVGRKLARDGAAAEFSALMQSAPEHFRQKAQLESRALEGILLIATENYDKAASVLETAMTKAADTGHPASELLNISHLLYAYEQLDNAERKSYWLQRGNEVIARAVDAGYGQIEFITEVAFFHAAAGQAEEASKAFWHALTMGKIAPWEITDDVRISRIQRSDALKPVVQQAASRWTV